MKGICKRILVGVESLVVELEIEMLRMQVVNNTRSIRMQAVILTMPEVELLLFLELKVELSVCLLKTSHHCSTLLTNRV